MSAPYSPPPSAQDEARALLTDLRTLLDRADSLINRLGADSIGMRYDRPADEPEAAAIPPEVAGYPHNSRRRFP